MMITLINHNTLNMKRTSTIGMRSVTALVLVMILTASTNSFARNADRFYRVFWNSFKASVKNNNTITLTWEVTEYNNKSFHIQHSLDGKNWQNIDSVVSRQSAESLEEYSYTHTNKIDGKHFYRMMDIDVDMRLVGYSEVITVIIKSDATNLSVGPNPASSQVRIANNNGRDAYVRATVHDLSGKMVAEKNLNSHSDLIDISSLIPGIYVIRAESKSGSIFSQKIVKH